MDTGITLQCVHKLRGATGKVQSVKRPGCGPEDPGFDFWQCQDIFLICKTSGTDLGSTLASFLSSGYRRLLCLKVMWPGNEVCHWLLPNIEVKNEQSCSSSAAIRFRVVDRHNFSFYLRLRESFRLFVLQIDSGAWSHLLASCGASQATCTSARGGTYLPSSTVHCPTAWCITNWRWESSLRGPDRASWRPNYACWLVCQWQTSGSKWVLPPSF